ncbi:MAG: hypothetical protein J6S21_05690, partial [Victivallales bacterium]|nr:hypothetical protein [Victivallales bacterium]
LVGSGCATSGSGDITPAGGVNAETLGRQALVEIMEKLAPDAAMVMVYSVKDGKELCRATTGSGMDEVVPHSALRPFVMAAALDAGTLTPEDTIDFGDGIIRIPGRNPIEGRLKGEQPLSAVIASPSFHGTMLVLKRIGKDAIKDFFGKAGFDMNSGMKNEVSITEGSGFQVNAGSLCTGWCLLARQETFMNHTTWPYVSADIRGRYGDRIAVVVGPVRRSNADYVLLTMVEGGTQKFFSTISSLKEIWDKYSAAMN